MRAWNRGLDLSLGMLACLVLSPISNLGCRAKPQNSAPQHRSAHLARPSAQSCRQTCELAQRCGADTPQCEARCHAAREPEAIERCAQVRACEAFLACHAQALPAPSPSGAGLAQACAAQCEAQMQCQREQGCQAQRFGALEIPGCEGDAATGNDATQLQQDSCVEHCIDSGRPCPTTSCDALEACIFDRPAGAPVLALSTSPTPLATSPACQGLCDRALRCGIEASGATAHEQQELAHVLPAALLDSQTECLLQCHADYREERRTDFEACLQQPTCERFLDCANAL